ncbi:MAG: DMT family transporter [Bacteroidales bacterium]|nr:DMT family transporter [Bacteroidales bacterium]MDY5193204.1 DMT family transporter [Candidatus Aphodosoma sp.]
MNKKLLSAYLAIIFAMSVWACSFLFTQEALKSFNPITVVTIRMSLATLILGLVGIVTGQLQKIDKADIPLFLIAGFSQPFCYFICEAYGLTMVSATIASVILSTIPLFAPLFAWLLVKEKVLWNNVLGIVISLCGVLMLVIKNDEMKVSALGILLLFIAVITAIVYSVCLKKIPSHYSNISIVFYVHAVSLLFFIPTFLIFDLKHFGEREILFSSIMSIIILAVVASVISYICFCYVVRIIGVTKANAFCNIMPAITALAVWIFFGESISLLKWIGIFVVIIGLFICQSRLKLNNH